MLIYFFKNGQLPWMSAEEKNDAHGLLSAHQSTSMETLLQGVPEWLERYMRAVKDLSFQQKPDYKSLLNIFAEELKIKKFKIEDDGWDWDIQRQRIIKMKIQQEEIEKQ